MSEESGIWPDYNKDRIGQLIVCEGGTCGNKEKGAHPIPFDQLKESIKTNGLKKHFKFKISNSYISVNSFIKRYSSFCSQ